MAGKQIPLTDELRAYLVAHSDPPRTDVHRDLMETTAREIGDLAFIDADKENYVTYYEIILDRMESGGLIVADNTLWSGAVLDENDTSESTVAIREFNAHVVNDERVDALLVNVGDGLMLARKR